VVKIDMSVRLKDLGGAAVLLLCVGGSLALGACADTRAGDPPMQRDASVEAARQLCTDLGYKSGTTEFAQCAQAEYDRLVTAASSQPNGWFENWLRKPAVCSQTACATR
jgi:hypothetical protein